jgi:signal transduction histidine kinase
MRLARTKIEIESDIVTVRQRARDIAKNLEFGGIAQTRIATAVSEIARNAFNYAGGGEVSFSLENWRGRNAFVVRIADQGPGIPNLEAILQGRAPASRGLGMGLVGCQRILSDFQVETTRGKGTTVTLVQSLESAAELSHVRLERLSRQLVREWRSTTPSEAFAQQNTELLETLDELRAQRDSASQAAEELEAVIASVPEIVFVVDADLRLRRSNASGEAFYRNLRQGESEVGRQLMERIRRQMEKRDDYLPHSLDDVLLFRIAEQEFYFLPRVVILGKTSPFSLGATVMLQDVTELCMLDQVRTNMLGTASHELKTPITSARLAIMMLSGDRDAEFSPRQEELLGIAQREMEKLLRTVYLFLDVIRLGESKEGLQRQVTTPADLLEQTLDQTFSKHDKNRQRVTVECAEDLPELHVNLTRMIYALSNLVSNAIKYSPADAPVSLSAMPDNESSGVVIRVRDKGVGISPEYHAKIFERFFRVPGVKVSGTGLGLSIVADFVRMNGGEVTLESTPGEGSCFIVSLPAAPEGAENEIQGSASQVLEPSGSGEEAH